MFSCATKLYTVNMRISSLINPSEVIRCQNESHPMYQFLTKLNAKGLFPFLPFSIPFDFKEVSL